MSKRNKGARARARKAKLAALRAELVLLLEEKLVPYHMQLNIQSTQRLLDDFRLIGHVPLWASPNYVKHGAWADELSVVKDQTYTKLMDSFNQVYFTGTGIVRLTPGQHSGTIMDMDSGNASGHDT